VWSARIANNFGLAFLKLFHFRAFAPKADLVVAAEQIPVRHEAVARAASGQWALLPHTCRS
jgi:hypothetical protein